MKHTKQLAVGFLAVLLTLEGCGLLPKEKERQEAPVLNEATLANARITDTVRRATITQTVSAGVRPVPLVSETVSFSDEELEVTEVYVAVGDEVKPGDALAEEASDELRMACEDKETELELKKAEVAYQETISDLAVRQGELALSRMTDPAAIESQKESISNTQWELYSRLNQLRVERDELEAELRELEEKLEACTLRANAAGTVVYISPDKRSFTVEDMGKGYLRIETETPEDFPVGKKVQLTCFRQEETCTVLSASQAGMPEGGLYVLPKELAGVLGRESRGEISYLAGESGETLVIREDAIQILDEETYVYILDTDGLITPVEVKVGTSGDGMIQILSGIDEGDQVIVSY